MKKKTKSLLEELNSIDVKYDDTYLVEQTALNLITSVRNLITLINETYDEETSQDLEKRLMNSIRSGDEKKFLRGIYKSRDKE
jgi:hypothetical protein